MQVIMRISNASRANVLRSEQQALALFHYDRDRWALIQYRDRFQILIDGVFNCRSRWHSERLKKSELKLSGYLQTSRVVRYVQKLAILNVFCAI